MNKCISEVNKERMDGDRYKIFFFSTSLIKNKKPDPYQPFSLRIIISIDNR